MLYIALWIASLKLLAVQAPVCSSMEIIKYIYETTDLT